MKPTFPLIDFLREMAERPGTTDITLCADGRVALRQNARIVVSHLDALSDLWKASVGEHFPSEKRRHGQSVTAVFTDLSGRRYRATLTEDYQGESLSVRVLPAKILGANELMLPEGLERYFQNLRGGLFLVGGPTGSGKSTTIASLLQSRAAAVGGKVVTLEDPVEYLHHGSESCVFIQREIGRQVRSYAEGLKDALLMNPDVISVQELREQAAAETALSAALSGHLVVASLHAYTASSVPQRFLSIMNPALDDLGAREAFAACVEGVIVQRLVPGFDGLVPIFEVMLFRSGTERLVSMERLVRQGSWTGLRQEIECGQRHGMLLLEESLRQRAELGLIPPPITEGRSRS